MIGWVLSWSPLVGFYLCQRGDVLVPVCGITGILPAGFSWNLLGRITLGNRPRSNSQTFVGSNPGWIFQAGHRWNEKRISCLAFHKEQLHYVESAVFHFKTYDILSIDNNNSVAVEHCTWWSLNIPQYLLATPFISQHLKAPRRL